MVYLSDEQIERLRLAGAAAVFAGRFELLVHAGEGGMGRVYQALDAVSGERVALKVLTRRDAIDLARFVAEARVLAGLDHPAIARYIAHGSTERGEPYLAMAWLEGGTLAQRLRRGSLAAGEAIALAGRIASGLEYAHARGVVHRDLKPSNVILVGGEPANAVLVDFGIARPLVRDTRLTRTGQIVGTPGYMAPEQELAGGVVDGRADLFALGCLLREALDGSPVPARLSSLIDWLEVEEADGRPDGAGAVLAEVEVLAAAMAAGDRAVLDQPIHGPGGRTRRLTDGLATTLAPRPPAAAAPGEPRDHLGRVLGEFVVRQLLGKGGFGAVYRAEQPALGRELVIKILHPKLVASEAAVQRFLREARLASQLDHPYAAHIYAFGAEPDGVLWIAMELVRGTPLDQLLAAHGPIALDRFVPLLDRICEVVQTAHDQGIIHRDIKPANVMVLSRAGRLLPKLLDFGVAKLDDDERPPPMPPAGPTPSGAESARSGELPAPASPAAGDAVGLTLPGSAIGSPLYMAPEQWSDVASVGARADVYALGILCYESLTGRPPFLARSQQELAEAHALQPLPPLGPGFPAELEAVLVRATAKAPADRFASALELASAFRAASGVSADAVHLPRLEAGLRLAAMSGAPRPIALAVEALDAARNPHQARDALWQLVRTAIRFAGVTALACHSHVGPTAGDTDGPLGDALRRLRGRAPGDADWFGLACDLVRPFARLRDAYPVPELIDCLLGPAGELIPELLAVRAAAEEAGGGGEEQVRALLERALPLASRLLAELIFLHDYPLLVPTEEGAEEWVGVRRAGHPRLAARGHELVPGRPVLSDAAGVPIVELWPFAQVHEPVPGAGPAMFLLEGGGRRGARLVALPDPFEHEDQVLWQSLRALLSDGGEAGAPDAPPDRGPFPGLAAFTTSDAGSFFGREQETAIAVNRVHRSPLVAVVGPSGAGKSSFVQAGVLPALPPSWLPVVVRPGPAPIAALRARLEAAGLDLGADASGAALRAAALHLGATVVLVVDQLEELFTVCRDPTERAAYVELLLGAARSPDDPVRVIATLRDDFLVRAEALCGGRLSAALQLLDTPAEPELRRILLEPVRRAGYQFDDPALPDEMVRDVAGIPVALALLSFTASKLWELRDRRFRQLPRKAYTSLGGVGGALAQHAEALLLAMPAEEQRLVREVFRHAVTAEGTRAPLARAELAERLGGSSHAEVVIEKLVAARLLAVEAEAGGDRIEITHEALLAAWPRLVTWRREDAEGARLRDQLRAAVKQWRDRERPRDLLWRGEVLGELRLWMRRQSGGLSADEEAFAAASLTQAARERRVRRRLVAGALVLLAAAVVALTWFNREARHQTGEARRHIVALYTEQGRRALLDGYRQRALVYLAEAWRRGGRDPALRFLLRRSGTSLDQEEATLSGHRDWVRDARFSPDGARVITVSDDRTARLWDTRSGALLHELRGHGDQVRAVAFDPAGAAVLTVGWDGSARLWQVASGRQLWAVDLRRGRPVDRALHGVTRYLSLPCAADVSPDGQRLVAGCVDRKVAILSRAGAIEGWLDGAAGLVSSAAFSPDGQRVLVIDDEGAPRVHQLASEQVAELRGHEGGVRTGSWSRDGRRIVTVGRDDTARVWSEAGEPLVVMSGHQGVVIAAAFSPDGARVMTSGVDRALRIWDAADGHLITAARLHQAPVGALAVSPDGSRIFTGDQSGVGVLSDRDGRRLAVLEGHRYMVWTARFSADGARVVTAGGDGTARVWRVGGDRFQQLVGHQAAVTGVRFTPSGTLVSASEDATLRLWPGGEVFARVDQPLWALQLSGDGALVAAGGVDGSVRIWQLATRRLLHTLAAHRGTVYALAFDPAGARLATTGADGVVRLWDLERGARLAEMPTGSDKEFAVGFAPDGLVASAGMGGAVRFWDPAAGRPVRSLAHDAEVSQLVFCGDRLLAASGSAIRIWRADGGPLSVIAGTGEAIIAPSCRDQRVVASGGHDVGISDLATGTTLERIDLPGAELLAIDAADDGRIAVGALDGAVTVVRLEMSERAAEELASRARGELPLELGEGEVVRLKR